MIKILVTALILCLVNCNKKDDGLPDNPVFNDPAFDNVPEVTDMTVYEMNIPAFTVSGTIKSATQRLDSVKNLGINVIWLMPIYPIGHVNAVGSPYCVSNYTGVNPSFGTLDDLREFVRTAHNKDMAVILDWVADHTSWDNPCIQHKSWYKQDANGNIISPVGTTWTDVAQLDYSNSTMRAEMIKSIKYWITQSNVDGFRFDAVDFVPSSFWQQAIDSLKAMPGRNFILIAEGGKTQNFTDGFQMNYSWDFVNTLKSVFSGEKAMDIFKTDSAEYNAVPVGCEKLRYITNHDLDFNSSLIEDYNSADGSLAAFVITAFLRGVPLVYDGQEVAYPYNITYFQSGSSTPVSWNINPDIYNRYKEILNIRDQLTAVKNGSLTRYAGNNVIAFKRYDQNEEILVLVNVRNVNEEFTIPAELSLSVWTDLSDNSTMSLNASVNLAPYEYMVLKNKNY